MTTIMGPNQALTNQRHQDHTLESTRPSDWNQNETMTEIYRLFNQLKDSASLAQGDRAITRQYITELHKLNKKLRACWKILLQLLVNLKSNDQERNTQLAEMQASINNSPNLELIRNELEKLVAYMRQGGIERETFQRELQDLASQIDALCQYGTTLEREMEQSTRSTQRQEQTQQHHQRAARTVGRTGRRSGSSLGGYANATQTSLGHRSPSASPTTIGGPDYSGPGSSNYSDPDYRTRNRPHSAPTYGQSYYGGWRTPEKGSPMRTLISVKKQKKKKKYTKKNKKKRKKRKRKGTRRRGNRKR